MKKLQKTPNFFERNEKYFVWMSCTVVFCTLIMLLSVRIFELKLPFVGWQIFIESIGTLSFLVAASGLWWSISSDRRQAERKAQIQELATIVAKLDEYYTMLLQQQETDRRLEDTIKNLLAKVDSLSSDLGRVNAQVCQFEGEVELRKRVDRLEMATKKLPSN